MLGLQLMLLALLGAGHAAPSSPDVSGSAAAGAADGGTPTGSILEHDPVYLATALAIVGQALSEQIAAGDGAAIAAPADTAAPDVPTDTAAIVGEGITLASDIVAAVGHTAFPEQAPIGQGLTIASDIVAGVGQGISPTASLVANAEQTPVLPQPPFPANTFWGPFGNAPQAPLTALNTFITKEQAPLPLPAVGSLNTAAQITASQAFGTALPVASSSAPVPVTGSTEQVAPAIDIPSTAVESAIPSPVAVAIAAQTEVAAASDPFAAAATVLRPQTVGATGPPFPQLPAPPVLLTALSGTNDAHPVGSRDSLQFDVAAVLAAARLGAQHATQHHEAAQLAAERQFAAQQAIAQHAAAQSAAEQQGAEVPAAQQVELQQDPAQETAEQISTQQQTSGYGEQHVGLGHAVEQVVTQQIEAEQATQELIQELQAAEQQQTEQTPEQQTITQQAVNEEVQQTIAVQQAFEQAVAAEADLRQIWPPLQEAVTVSDGIVQQTAEQEAEGQAAQQTVIEQHSPEQRQTDQVLAAERATGAEGSGILPVAVVEDSIPAQVGESVLSEVQLLGKTHETSQLENEMAPDAMQISILSGEEQPEVQQTGLQPSEEELTYRQTIPVTGEVRGEQETSFFSEASSSGDVLDVLESSSLPDAAPSVEVPDVLESSSLQDLAPSGEVLDVLESSSLPDVAPSGEVPDVLESSSLPDVAPSGEVLNVLESSSLSDVAPSGDVLDVLESSSLSDVAPSTEVLVASGQALGQPDAGSVTTTAELVPREEQTEVRRVRLGVRSRLGPVGRVKVVKIRRGDEARGVRPSFKRVQSPAGEHRIRTFKRVRLVPSSAITRADGTQQVLRGDYVVPPYSRGSRRRTPAISQRFGTHGRSSARRNGQRSGKRWARTNGRRAGRIRDRYGVLKSNGQNTFTNGQRALSSKYGTFITDGSGLRFNRARYALSDNRVYVPQYF